MKLFFKFYIVAITILGFVSCTTNSAITNSSEQVNSKHLKYLALGDSYTVGQSVCETCRFPIQLQDTLKKQFTSNTIFSTEIIATTGWTTTDLKNAIATQNPASDYDLVTLLIGVNNQYQNKPFSLYQQEFPELVNMAIAKAKGNKNNVIIISIPDYAYTPFGQGTGNQANISSQIQSYNLFASTYATQIGIKFVNITDITQQGISNPALVASDGLHPSKLAYSKFVERIFPKAKLILGF